MQKLNQTFAEEMRSKGFEVVTGWTISGPENTAVITMQLVMVISPYGKGCSFIVQTFDDGGWEVFGMITQENTIDATVVAATKMIEGEE